VSLDPLHWLPVVGLMSHVTQTRHEISRLAASLRSSRIQLSIHCRHSPPPFFAIMAPGKRRQQQILDDSDDEAAYSPHTVGFSVADYEESFGGAAVLMATSDCRTPNAYE
jgi:hypothetical protein